MGIAAADGGEELHREQSILAPHLVQRGSVTNRRTA